MYNAQVTGAASSRPVERRVIHFLIPMQKLWKHEETGRLVWHENPGARWYSIPIMNEDELPEMTDDEYDTWYENSHIPDGVGCRMGPKI